MTKFEFIQEAALRILSRDGESSMISIADYAAELGDEVWKRLDSDKHEPAQEHEPEILKCFSNEEPIKDLIDEVDRLDIEDKKRLTEEYRHSWNLNYTAQKSGYAFKLRNVLSIARIGTIPELLAFGRANFLKLHNVGKKLCDAVDKALENLYDIKSW